MGAHRRSAILTALRGPRVIHALGSLCTTTTCSPLRGRVMSLRSHHRRLQEAIYAGTCKRTSENSVNAANFAESPFHALGCIAHSPAPIGQDRRRGDARIVGCYVSYVQFWQTRGSSVHKTTRRHRGGAKPK